MMIQRSFNHVSIVLLGLTGAGKSTAINNLLGVDCSSTCETESETRSTKEFIIHVSNPKDEVERLPLGLVDTPGFCDTDGLEQDACNLFSVQSFFRTHPDLSGCYPNLIFLFVNANDNRIMGENSKFEKSLRCVKQLGLVDPENPNVVIILTHVCSIQKKNGKEWTKALDKVKLEVSKIVLENLNVSAPVILIENMYDDCDLEYRGNYTLLPNGELQPKNLYEASANILVINNDSLGLITFNSIFVESRKSEDRRITLGHEFEAKNAKQRSLGGEERAMVEIFELSAAKKGTVLFAFFQYNK